MFTVEASRAKRLMVISYSQRVTAAETSQALDRVRRMMGEFEPGFRVLTDMRWLESMEPAAAISIGQIMEVVASKDVSMVVRIVPDPQKDIGFNILSQFHYGDNVRIMTYQTLAEALECLMEVAVAEDQGN